MKITQHTQDLFDRLKKLRLPLGKYAVFGSGPLGIRGMHDCRDLDVIVTEEVYEKFRRNPAWKEKISKSGSTYLDNADLELYQDWKPGNWDISRLIAEAEMIGGLPFVTMQHVMSWKKLNGRVKDLKHIQDYEDSKE